MRTEPLAQRLLHELTARLAVQANCCPRHGTRLICALCDVHWTASAGEKMEVEALVDRSLAVQSVAWPRWPCGRCDTQDVALCIDCSQPTSDQAFAGLTPAEEARLVTLLDGVVHLTCLPAPDVADGPMGAHEGGETP